MSDYFLRKDGGFDSNKEKNLFKTPPDTARKRTRSRTEPESPLKRFNNQNDLEDIAAEESTPRISMARSNPPYERDDDIEMEYQS